MKRKKISLCVGALLCSAMIGTLMIRDTNAADPLDPDANHDAAMQLVNAYEADVKTFLSTNYPDLTVQYDKGESIWRPFYKPDSVNAYVRLMWGYALEISYGTDFPDDPSDEMIADFLVGKGFSKYLDETEGYPSNTEYINSNTGVICSYVKGTSLNGLSCSAVSELQMDDKWQNFLNGVGTAYNVKQNKLPFIAYDNVAFSSDPVINNSEYEPYQYVEVPMGNFIGLFYRSNPSSDWVYFTGTQAPLECSEFTGELQKGFAGYICYNGDVASKVAVATDEEESSSVKVPDTGVAFSDKKALITLSSVSAIVVASVTVYVTVYAIKRFRKQVGFDK